MYCYVKYRLAILRFYMYFRSFESDCGPRQFAPEEYLYRCGEVANEMFFIVSGSVEELAEKPDKKVWVLSFAFKTNDNQRFILVLRG